MPDYGRTAGATINPRRGRTWSILPPLTPARQNQASPLRPVPFRLRDNNADGVLNRAVLIFFLQTVHERHTWANPRWNRRWRHWRVFWAGPLIGTTGGQTPPGSAPPPSYTPPALTPLPLSPTH